jgi:hypothetical protein
MTHLLPEYIQMSQFEGGIQFYQANIKSGSLAKISHLRLHLSGLIVFLSFHTRILGQLVTSPIKNWRLLGRMYSDSNALLGGSI